MSTLFIVILIVSAVAVGYFFFKKNIFNKKIDRVITSDPAAQASYNKKYTHEDNSLSLEENIEKSWQFLIDIREYVINKFSKSDQDKIKKAGLKMASHNMQYQHDINTIGSLSRADQGIAKETKTQKQSSR
jgi:flagellar basal body-associated protein FliL